MINPKENEFLMLAAKVMRGKATAEENIRLTQYVQDDENYRTTLDHMKAFYQSEEDDQFLETVIHVLCGTAKPKEIEGIKALKNANPQRWRKFQFIRAVVTGIDRASKVGDTVPQEAMPDRVRQALLAKLKR